ncbi:MAG: T9SS type B sorting domain-containing protein [Putridiphycobacter sp.]
MKLIHKIFFIGGLLISSVANAQNTTCEDMAPICTDAGLTFTAQSGGPSAQSGNNYSCLGSQPNPAWYYLEIATAGQLDMSLSAPSDIDFIIYGPFTDLATAVAGCGSMGQGGAGQNVIDCSYSATNNETPSIPNAQVGEVYVMLITNYANQVQDVVLQQTGGTASTDCSIVTQCVSNPGTFVSLKNGVPTALSLYLCEGESFSVVSNQDYTLPNDTIAAPVGDGIYSSQLMWLPYSAPPTFNAGIMVDPATDPAFLGFSSIIPTDNLNGTNAAGDPLLTGLGGCGTYYFVPVAGDDGVGGNNNVANGTNDNGGLHWDKDGNGCYEFGTPIEVTFACPITATPSTNCATLPNGVDIAISGGNGSYNIINQGQGNLVSQTVANGGTAQIQDLINNQNWAIDITDSQGCTASASGTFSAPTIIDTNFVPAPTCNGGGGNGTVEVILGTTGSTPYTVTMNGTTTTTPYIYSDLAGTGVTVVVTDNLGCTTSDVFTITSADHYIDVNITAQTDEDCYGDGNGSATITAVGVDAFGNPDGSTITAIDWTDPNGNSFPGGATNLSQTGMTPGTWTVEVTDNTGCSVTIPVTIGAPQELDIFVTVNDGLQCYNDGSGDVTVDYTGGVFAGQASYQWDDLSGDNPNVTSVTGPTANQLNAGLLEIFVVDDNGCMDSIEVEVLQPDEIDRDVIIKDVDCYGDNSGAIIITDVYNNQGNVSYIWNLVTFPNPPDTVNVASGLSVGVYEIKITDEQGCFKIFSDTITQNDYLYWGDINLRPSICRNQIPFDNPLGQIDFLMARDNTLGNGSTNNYEYYLIEVNTNDTLGNFPNETTVTNLAPGNYMIHAYDEYGCMIDTTVTLDSLSPIASFEMSSPQFTSDYVGTAPVEVTLTNTSENYAFANNLAYNGNNPNTDVDTVFIWSFGLDSSTFETELYNPLSITYNSEGIYTVCLTVVENLNGCIDSTCKEIQIFDVPSLEAPNVFTPDGDGINDYFYFPNHVIVEFSATVTDRWGKIVYIYDDINDAWNGTNMKNGRECTDGVYFYVYEGTSSNGTEYKGQGTVQIIRKK